MAVIRFQVILTTREEEGKGHSMETDGNLREREKIKESEDKGQSFPNGGDRRRGHLLPACIGEGQAIARMGDYDDGRGETWLLSGLGASHLSVVYRESSA